VITGMPIRERAGVRLRNRGQRLARKCEVPSLQSTNYRRIRIKELLYFRGDRLKYPVFVVF
jgi:hypothetical protein